MKLLTGPAGSGKTRRVLSGFREALAAGAAARVIVPTSTLAEHLRNELARGGLAIRSNAVETLAGFLKELAPGLTVASDALFRLMVEDAALRLDRPEFRKVCGFPGFHARLAATIQGLDAAGGTPRQLERVRGDLAPFRDALTAVWIDVERQKRERNLVTRGELLRKVTADLKSAILPERIWMDGFAQLSGPEIEFIEALGKRVKLTLTLPDEGLPAGLKASLTARSFVEECLVGSREPCLTAIMPETPERECEEIVRRILECSRGGTALREIGVVVRKPEKYEPLLRATFERFRVPAHFYFPEKLETHAMGRLLGGVIEALEGGWEHEQTLELLRLAPSTGSSAAMDRFEIAVREALPGRGLDALAALAKDRSLQRVLQNLSRLNAWLHERVRPQEWAERFGRLASLFRPLPIADRVTPAEAAMLRSQAAGARAFAEAMREAALWWPTPTNAIGLAEFQRVGRAMVRLSSVSASHRVRNAVNVIHPYEARQWDLSAVFVCGLVETEFPAHVGRDPFLPDAALRDLRKQGVRVPTTDEKDDEERGLFDAVCASARDLVSLSQPRTDARGQRNLRSIFLKDIPVEIVDAGVRPALPAATARWRQPAALRSPDVLESMTTEHSTLSVTSLESLLQCPFQFFAKRALRIREMAARPEDRLDFLLQGSIVHEVLNEWFSERPPLKPLFDKVFALKCEEKRVVPGYRMERTRRTLFLALERFMADTKYPAGLKSQTERPFEFALDATLNIRGKMDRIDELEDGRGVVIDYKFSRAANTKSKVSDPTKLQGPLYAMALQRAFGLEPAAMLYISLKDEKLSYSGWGDVPGINLGPRTTLAPLTREWMDDAIARVSDAIAEFRSGVIHARPASMDPCRYCTYRDACRFEEPMAIPVSGA